MEIREEITPVPRVPLAIGEATTIATLTTDDGEVFTISFGLNTQSILKLKEYSCDTSDKDLMQFTSDHDRFCTHAYEDWYAKERYPFALLNQERVLAGLVWLGPKALPLDTTEYGAPETQDTFAIRMYQAYRGKRLAKPFANFAIAYYRRMRPGRVLWLQVDPENVGASHLYEKLSFVEVGVTDTKRPVMVFQ